jgi:Tol biopolymer transport system component
MRISGLMNARRFRHDQTDQEPFVEGEPTWSPDGRKIAFVRGSEWGCEWEICGHKATNIWVMGRDGSGG